MSDILSFKESLVNSGAFKRTPTNPNQYRGRLCPKCGDSKFHCYIKITLTDEEPPVWHCFKCNMSGVVNTEFLKAYDIDLKMPNIKYHKRIESNNELSIKNKDMVTCDSTNISGVSQYTFDRIGVTPTLEELQMFRYVGNPHAYVREFFGDDYNKNMIMNRHWFQLNNGNIIGRSSNDNMNSEYRWIRYRTKHVHGRGIYTFRIGVDTHIPINVVIAEGIYDVIGLYYHNPMKNSFYIATLGSDYKSGIEYMLKMGIFGNSVSINIYKDSDVNTNSIYIPNELTRLFKHISIYGNMIEKDYGLNKNQLDIQCIRKIK